MRQPTPAWDYIASCLMTWYATMYILSGIVRKVAPKTYKWAEQRVYVILAVREQKQLREGGMYS